MDVIQGYGNDPSITDLTDEILTLYNNNFDYNKLKDFNELCANEKESTYLIVVRWQGKPIALTALKWFDQDPERMYWYMFNFCVRKHRMREGWGTKLFDEVKKFTHDKPVLWLVDDDNIGAKLFYSRMGAKQTETTRDGVSLFAYCQKEK